MGFRILEISEVSPNGQVKAVIEGEDIFPSLPPEMLTQFLNGFEKQWRATKNPLLAWRAYEECRKAEAEPPGWFFEYLDEACLELIKIRERFIDGHRSVGEHEVAEAFDFSGTGVKQFRALFDAKQMEIGQAVFKEMVRNGFKKNKAEAVVASYHKISEKSARNYFEAWLKKTTAPG